MTGSFPATLRVGVLVFDDFEPLDVWGFVEAFCVARFLGTRYIDGPPYPFEVLFISDQIRLQGTPAAQSPDPRPLRSYNGPRVLPDMFRDDALSAGFDVLMIPGGLGTRALLDPSEPEALRARLDWIMAMDERVQVMSSVCSGAALLAATGLLDGKAATTNHQSFAWVAEFGPRVLWDKVPRWVDAGHYLTSAGVSAGTDMAFHLVSRLAGRAVAEQAVLACEYDWRRDPNEPIQYPA